MKEKELRLALVYYGGVSLAIYQHGVNVEILNLLRASRAYHAANSFAAKQADDYSYTNIGGNTEDSSTEAIYFDLLKLIGGSLDLRVIVDVIAGSSAGGINGIALARAVAHDLSLAPLTEMWFAKADLLQLIAPTARASIWSKWYFWPFMRPLLGRLAREGLLPRNPDAEIRERISTFIRSRWFKPPFDGRYFSNLLLDGLAAMEGPQPSTSTLLPPGNRLDLLITVTDFYGAQRTIFLHDPVAIHEREHRQLLRFHVEWSKDGREQSDFDLGNIPSLAFAGRASSSYPGAFPPAQLQEMDEVIAARGLAWPGRSQFLEANFPHYQDIDIKPEATVLLDGSILNNKPILAALEAIRTHSAFREVDRRLVYIDPRPDRLHVLPGTSIPGFFETLRGALSDLPRHTPIYEELEETSRLNDQIGRLKAIVQISRGQVDALIDQATAGGLSKDFTIEQLRHWRLTSSNLLSRTAIVYNAWWRSLVLESADFISDLVSKTCGYQRSSQRAHRVRRIIEAWCEMEGLFPENYLVPDSVPVDAELPVFVQFVVDFGVNYKKRRLTFVIQDLNTLYTKIGEPDFCKTSPQNLDVLKKRFYDCLSSLKRYEQIDFLSDKTVFLIQRIFGLRLTETISDPRIFAEQHRAALTEAITQVGKECNLARSNDESDAVFVSPLVSALGVNCRRMLLTGYLGYPYWDVILLPAMSALGLQTSAFEEVLVDRISPQDATTIRTGDGKGQLEGAAIVGFGGFLSRTTRENDYLWGRIHAIDRLIDIVTSTIEFDPIDIRPDLRAFKKRAFEAMLRQEAPRLSRIPDVVAAVKAAITRL